MTWTNSLENASLKSAASEAIADGAFTKRLRLFACITISIFFVRIFGEYVYLVVSN